MSTDNIDGLDQKSRERLFDYISQRQIVQLAQSLKKVSQSISKPNSEDAVVGSCLDKITFGEYDTPLIVHAADVGNIEAINILLEYNVDVNNSDSRRRTAVWYACYSSNTSIALLLLSHGADPSIFEKEKQETTMVQVAYEGNLDIIKALLNDGKKYKYAFDWDKLINQCDEAGYNAFHYCCERGNLDCLKYLLSKEKQFKTKIDKWSKTKSSQANGLLLACNGNRTRMIQFLVEDIYNDEKKDGKFDINDTNVSNSTALRICSYFGNLEAIKYICKHYKDSINVNQCNHVGMSPFYTACMNNRYECVSWYLDNDLDDILKINVNLADKNGKTPLMVAIENGNEETIDALCSDERIGSQLMVLKDKDDKDALDYCVYFGNIEAFCTSLLAILKQHKIVSLNDDSIDYDKFKAGFGELRLFERKKLDLWYRWCHKQNNSGLFAFLTKLDERGIKENNFGYLVNALRLSSIKVDKQVGDVGKYYDQMRISMFQSNYLFLKLKKDTLMDLSNVINNSLLKQECGFDDSLLFLCKLINDKQFSTNLEKITNECLGSKSKNIVKHQFFKKYLLNSNIWAMDACGTSAEKQDKQEKKETKEEKDEKEKSTNNKNETRESKTEKNQSLFNQVELSVLEHELKCQQEFIKNNMIEIRNTYKKEWKDLCNSIEYYNLGFDNKISQNYLRSKFSDNTYFMKDYGIESDYSKNEMPHDNENGFVGSDEYDKYGYLTKLLMASHQIDPIFQKDAKKYFIEMKNIFGIECEYHRAPVKTRERCIMKSEMDYKKESFPHSSHILDVIRCSVVFNDIKHLLNGITKFTNDFFDRKNLVDEKLIEKNKNCSIKCIVRIKNDFLIFGDCNDLNEIKLNQFRYRDIKFNILIEYNHIRLIGEVQFLMSFMLNAKKMQHSIYSFQRKGEFFDKLSLMNREKEKQGVLMGRLQKIAMTHNMTQLALLLQTLSLHEKYFMLKKEKEIGQVFQQNGWKKGESFITLILRHQRETSK